MSRIDLTDSMMDVVVKMAEGNPGAVTALMELLEKVEGIDPISFLGGLGPILDMDTMGIYGSSIYILFSDKCDRDVRKMVMLLRAHQLGFIPEVKIQEMAADQAGKINLTEEEFTDLDNKVCERLPEFQKAA